MKKMTMRYPGDPPCEVLEMSRAEFLAAYPREPVRVFSGGAVEEIPMADDEIWCDYCGEDPGTTVILIGRTKACCATCAQPMLRHCEVTP